jgi:O-antigen ligase
LLLNLQYPSLGLYVLILLIPFSSLVTVSLGSFKVGLMEVVLALSLISWLLHALATRTLSFTLRPLNVSSAPLVWPFLLFLGAVSASWLTALSIGASLVETIKWVEMLALYLFVVAVLPFRQVKWVVITLVLAGLAQALLGLYQFIFKVGPPGFLLFEGQFLRAFGTFAQPNPYAGYLGLILPFTLALTIWAAAEIFKLPNKPKTSDVKLKIIILLLATLALSVLVAALFASQSRGAWLAFAAAGLATVIVGSKKPGLLLGLLVLGSATLGLLGAFQGGLQPQEAIDRNSAYQVVTQRLVDATIIATTIDISTLEINDANFATLERLAHWQAARQMWRDHPWLGVGFGNYAPIYPRYAVGRWLDPLGHAHNYLLNIGAEAGLAGIISYLIFWIFTFGVIWQAVQISDNFHRTIAAAGFGTIVHLHIHNLFDNLYVQGMYLHIAVILALMSIICYTSQQKSLRKNKGVFFRD